MFITAHNLFHSTPGPGQLVCRAKNSYRFCRAFPRPQLLSSSGCPLKVGRSYPLHHRIPYWNSENCLLLMDYWNILISDNGPQFVSTEFENFLKMNGIRHTCSAPYHPQTNGEAEHFVQTLKQSLRMANMTSVVCKQKYPDFC